MSIFRHGLRSPLPAIALLLLSGQLGAQSTLATFSLQEYFGVTWPTQNLEMKYAGGYPPIKTTRMIGADGITEIPYQWISGADCWDPTATNGCILVQDGLPANATHTYTLQSGVAPAATVANPVTVASGTCRGGMVGWIISNGLTGFCVPKTQASPYNYAPIQGIKLPGGAWTGAASGSANLIYTGGSGTYGGLAIVAATLPIQNLPAMQVPATSLFTSETTTFIEAGPLKTVVQLAYAASKPAYGIEAVLTSAGTSTTLTFTGGWGTISTSKYVMFYSGTPPSGLTFGTFYYPVNCTTPDGTTAICSLATTPGGTPITLGTYAGTMQAWGLYSLSGSGHYTVQITMYANRPAFMIDWDSDLYIQWFTPFYNEVQPNIRRYRGAGSPSVACGYESPLTITGITNTSPPVVTTSSVLNAVNGNQVVISGVSGATGANGTFYMGAINSPPGTFTLYNNAGLSSPATAPGVYTSGGIAKPQYTSVNNRSTGRDAFYDISYATNQLPDQNCVPGTQITALGVNYSSNWLGAGWYDEVYNSAGGSSAPVVGMFEGRFSKLLNVAGPEKGQPGWYASNSHWITSAQALGVEHILSLNSTSLTSHGNFGIYVGTAAQLGSPDSQQPIGTEMNAHAGINLSNLYTYTLSYSDPAGGWKYPYMNTSDFNNWLALFQNGTSFCGSTNCFWTNMVNAAGGVGGATPIYNMWHNNTAPDTVTAYNYVLATGASSPVYYNVTAGSWAGGTATLTIGSPHIFQPGWGVNVAGNSGTWTCYFCTITAVTSTTISYLAPNPSASFPSGVTANPTGVAAVVNQFANSDNKWWPTTTYYQWLQNQFAPNFTQCFAILANTFLTSTQKSGCKAVLAFAGSVIWDDDFFPWDNQSGDGFGLQNQAVLYNQYRSEVAAQLYFHPYLATKVALGNSNTLTAIPLMANQYGAGAASLHYQLNYTQPTYGNFQNMVLDGKASFNNYPTWKSHAQWLLSALTPPEPRFGSSRKCLSEGDGNTEATCGAYLGSLAEGLHGTDPTTAGNAIWGWAQTNQGNTYTMDSEYSQWLINPLIPQVAPTLGSSNFPGYWSVARYGFGGPHESTVHFINGDFYSAAGHRHIDQGQVSIYAHSAPLAIDWNANLYSPDTAAGYCHNRIVFDSDLGGLAYWYSDAPVCDLFAGPTGVAGPASNNTHFSAFPNSTQSTATFTYTDGTVWTRVVRTIAADVTYPLIYVKDTFSGPSAATAKTLTWNLMATGSVVTPAGSVSPIVRYSGPPNAPTGCNSPPAQYPSNGTVYSLANGLQQFNFTGAAWPAHATGGITWDLWEIPSSGSAQFLIGNWGHGCHSARETAEFQTANGVPFNERQHILRVHDTGAFHTLIAPYRNGEAPTRTVTTQSCGTQIVQGTETTCFSDSALTYTNGTQTVLTVYDTSSQSAYGFTAFGGAQELVNNGSGTITWTIEDITPGIRSVTLPSGTWYPSIPVLYNGGTYSYYHGGGPQPSPVTITFTHSPVTLRAVALDYRSPTGATQVRVKFGSASNYAAIAPCGPVCSVTLQAPSGTWPEQHDFLDGNGAVVTSSAVRSVVVP